jgi:hypothetical protein
MFEEGHKDKDDSSLKGQEKWKRSDVSTNDKLCNMEDQ